MENWKGTKGRFTNGQIGWRVGDRLTNGVLGCEIHYSDDGECITDHVYTIEDAKLIAAAPDLLGALQSCVQALKIINSFEETKPIIERAEKAIEKALK